MREIKTHYGEWEVSDAFTAGLQNLNIVCFTWDSGNILLICIKRKHGRKELFITFRDVTKLKHELRLTLIPQKQRIRKTWQTQTFLSSVLNWMVFVSQLKKRWAKTKRKESITDETGARGALISQASLNVAVMNFWETRWVTAKLLWAAAWV